MTRPPAPEIPKTADERTTLVAFLAFYRAALVDRMWGLGAAQLQAATTASSLTLGRLLGHMTYVEYVWYRHRFVGDPMPEPWVSMDWDTDYDAEMTDTHGKNLDELLEPFHVACADTDAIVAAAQLNDLTQGDHERGPWNLRWILVHMIEEYARHVGHADLIREAIDGDTLR